MNNRPAFKLFIFLLWFSQCHLDSSAGINALHAQSGRVDFCDTDQDIPSVGHPSSILMPRIATEIYGSEVPSFYELNGVNVNIGNQWHFEKLEHLRDIFSHARTFHFMNKDYWDDGIGQADGNKPATLRKYTPQEMHRLKLLVDAKGFPLQRNHWQEGDRIITFDAAKETLVEAPLEPGFYNVYENYLNQNWIYQKQVSDFFDGQLQTTLTVVNFNFPKAEAIAHNFPNQWYLDQDWGEARLTAKAYAMMFARAYAPKDGLYQVCKTLEIGNEPWGLKAEVYQQILEGFVEGFTSYYGADFKIQLLPAAFQGNHFENKKKADWLRPNWKDYLGTRLNTPSRCQLAGINIHNYSNDLDDRSFSGYFKERLIAPPEEGQSAFQYGKNGWYWLQKNMPPEARRLYASEYGWDTNNTCREQVNATAVGEAAQGIYTIRALLLHARMGVWRANVFELLDDKGQNPCQFAYHSSGFYTEDQGKLKAKLSVSLLHNFMQQVGNFQLSQVLAETTEFYLYELQNGKDLIRVGWLPLNINGQSLSQVQQNKKLIIYEGEKYELTPIPSIVE